MKCPSCKAPLEANARFCGVCGYRLSTSERPATSDAGRGGPANILVDPLALDDGTDPYTGTVLNNRFAIESKLGEGGFGAVYRGVQLGTGRKVAIKLLHPEMTKDDNLVARFRREGMVLCNLRDAHTITTYDFDQTADGTLYIAMELLEGRSLHDVFRGEAWLDWRRVFKILIEMCSSLAEAHTQGIVHRDLKPENIYLENRPGTPEFVKILDFGIAKVMQGEGGGQTPQLTATGQTLGTLEYMSPEQLMGKPLDGRSDIYALGVLAYELITGRLPFPDAKGPAALITAQLRKVPEPPSVANSQAGTPPAVDRIVLKMLEKDRGDRFADVIELRYACTAALQAASEHQSNAGIPIPPAHAPVAAHVPGPAHAPVAAHVPGPAHAPVAAHVPGPSKSFDPSAHAATQASIPTQQGPAPSLPVDSSRTVLWVGLAVVVVVGLIGAALALT